MVRAIKLPADSYGLFETCITLTVVNPRVTARERVGNEGEELC